MQFQNFDLEHYQSLYEHSVEVNLADSSVKATDVRELLRETGPEALLDMQLPYPHVNGTPLLRQRIAALYSSATEENILVTVGTAQANSMVCETLLEAGDEVIVFSPGYRQVWGLARNRGCTVKELQLHPENDWRPDLDQLEKLAGNKTKLIAVVNPNNPTGAILTRDEMQRIVKICQKWGAWLHADEVYRGTELTGDETPSFWGQYDRVVCTSSLSKAYGLAGLRLGWVAASPETIQSLWRRHEYAVIAAAGPSMKLAEIALDTKKRQALLARQKKLSAAGHAVMENWVREQGGVFSVRKAAATSVAFVRYHLDMPSLEVAEHFRRKASVLVAPGVFLGTEHHLRIAIGFEEEKIRKALDRMNSAIASLDARVAAGR